MAIFALVAAVGLGFASGDLRLLLVMVGLDFFIASFDGRRWRNRPAAAERGLPTAVRGQAAATGATVDGLANFALIEVFPVWNSGIGLGWVLVCFAALCVVAIAFVARFETKGLSLRGSGQARRGGARAGALELEPRSERRPPALSGATRPDRGERCSR